MLSKIHIKVSPLLFFLLAVLSSPYLVTLNAGTYSMSISARPARSPMEAAWQSDTGAIYT